MRAASIAWTGGETIEGLTIAGNAYRIALAQSRHEEGATRSACLWGPGLPNGNFAQMVLDTQVRKVRAQMHGHILGVIVLEIAVVTGVEVDDDRHDFAQAQLPLPNALALAVLEQTRRVDRLKDLAKIIDITEHSDELAHRDLRRVDAISWSIPLPYDGPYGLAILPCLSRIEVK